MMTGATAGFDRLVELAGRAGPGRRIIAVAGAPGSGKSTLAEKLVARLNLARPGVAAVLPMDGYHFDDRVLIDRGLRARKGAPETFDVGGLRHMLQRLKADAEDEIAVPVFDRDLEIARAGARLIPRETRIIVAEGNYLLLGQQPWASLHGTYDATVMIAAPEALLRERLTARWVGYGLAPDEITAKVDGNDLPNGHFVAAHSIEPHVVFAG